MGLRIPTKATNVPQEKLADIQTKNQYPQAIQKKEDVNAIEQIILRNGDISSLSPENRVSYYKNLCEVLGLNPATIPIMYLGFKDRNGNYKIIPYMTKDGAAQLTSIHKVSITIKEKIWCKETNTYQVWVEATTPDGRKTEDVGIVTLGEQAKGDIVANSIMKAMTKAKRRAVMSHCGLGFLDESEFDTMRGQKETFKIDEIPTEKVEVEVIEEKEKQIETIKWEKNESNIAMLLEFLADLNVTDKGQKIKLIEEVIDKEMSVEEVKTLFSKRIIA